MAKTIQEILDEARVLIQDTVEGSYRHPDEELVDYLNNGISEIRRIRPDYFINSFDAALPQFTTADLASDYPLDEQTNTAIVYFVAGNASLQDDENVLDGRASGLLSIFSAKLTSSGA